VKRFLQELRASISSVESDIALVDQRIARLDKQRLSSEDRLNRLADSRANYSNVLSEVKSKLAILEGAERELAEAQAARDSSISTSLLTRLDAPIVSDRPIGPGRTSIVCMCTFAGLVFGLGIVFVVTPIDMGPSFGRRSADRSRVRRDSEQFQTDAANPKPLETIAPIPKDLAPPLQSDAVVNKFQRTKLNLQSSSNPAQYLANSIAELSSDLAVTKTDQSESKVDESKPISESKTSNPSSKTDVDRAFQELARLRSYKPENRSEELSIQMKVQELKSFLTNQGEQSKGDNSITLNENEDFPRHKPRATRPN